VLPVNHDQFDLGSTVIVQLAKVMAVIAGMPTEAKMHHHSGGRSTSSPDDDVLRVCDAMHDEELM